MSSRLDRSHQPALSKEARRRRTGVRLMFGFLASWVLIQWSVQFYQGNFYYGFGGGWHDGGVLPPAVVEKYGTKDPVEAARRTMNKNTENTVLIDGTGFIPDTVRIVVSFGIMFGIIFFWYLVMSRTGTF